MIESNIHSNQLINYGYDRADRLTSVTYPNNEKTTYQLDKVGNRKKEIITGTSPNTKTYTYNDRDQLTGISDTLGSSTSYTYDNAGNQLTKDTDGLLTTFDYSPRQRVKSITVGAQVPINYQYDYTGQRINYERNGTEKRYIYDGLTLIAETNTIGNTIARYHYGDRYQLAEQRNNINSYYHVDSLGTNVAVTNQDGSIQARYEYDAYGNLLTQNGASETPFGFTGYQLDSDTGLYYANARYYDSNTGRFNREDPLFGNKDIPPSLHRYNYGYSNPTRFIDPDGKYAEDGHYYTTLIVAEALGFTAEQSNTLALYSQLPDEVDNLDATELVKNKGLSMLFTLCIYCDRANVYLPFLHALSGRKSEVETDRTVRAIIKSKDNLKSVGFLVHRLADTFAHRRLDDPASLYGSGIGHGKDGHTPDVIQQNTEQYEKYVNTLISTLAQVKGGLSDNEIKAIKQKVHAKMSRLRSIPIEQQTKYLRKGGKKYPVGQIQKESNNDITESSIRETKRIVVEEINVERRKNGKEPVNESYEPEKVGVDNFFGMDVWLLDALNYYEHITNGGKIGTIIHPDLFQKHHEAQEALRKAKKILNATPSVSLREAEKSNKALMVIEGDDNEIKLKEDNDE